jgi:hypothetical protein
VSTARRSRSPYPKSWRRQRGIRARAKLVFLFVADVAASWRGIRGPRNGRPHTGRSTWRTGQIAGDVKNACRIFTQSPMLRPRRRDDARSRHGAVTVIFSLADATLLRPFAFPEAERIVQDALLVVAARLFGTS